MELLLNIFGVLAVVVWKIIKAIGKAFMEILMWISKLVAKSVAWLWKVIDPLNRREREREEAIREAECRGRRESEEAMRVREEMVCKREEEIRRIEEKERRRERYAQKKSRDAIFDSTKEARRFIEDGENMNGRMKPAVRHFAEENHPEACKVIEILDKEIRCTKSHSRREGARSRRADLIRKIKKDYNQRRRIPCAMNGQ